MRQVLFHIPFVNVPIYGFGMMLCLTCLTCTWLAAWRARREGIRKEYLQDLAVWIFLGGLVGARTVYMIQYHEPITRFFMIWQGGLVFYGSALGGVAGYALAYLLIIRRHGLSTWKLADIVAPCVAIGLCLGRIGCFLNGCCYGNVACEHCPGVAFPFSSPARYSLVSHGLQTAAGFTLTDAAGADPRTVAAVNAGSSAHDAGLRPGDVIVAVNGQPVPRSVAVEAAGGSTPPRWYDDWGEARAAVRQMQGGHVQATAYDGLTDLMTERWQRGATDLALTVRRDGQEAVLPAFAPRTLHLHPTQLYESVSMLLVFWLLNAYYPFKRRDGEVMVLFVFCYAAHRFLNEVLRNDTAPVALGMTLSQNGSILLFGVGLVLLALLWRRPVQYGPAVAPA